MQVPNFLSGKTININKKNKTPINGDIKASEVMLIDQDGVKQGLISIEDALANAEAKSLDLVQVFQKGLNL